MGRGRGIGGGGGTIVRDIIMSPTMFKCSPFPCRSYRLHARSAGIFGGTSNHSGCGI